MVKLYFDKLTIQTNKDVCLTNETNHTILKMSKINIFNSDRLDGNHLHNNHLLTCPLNKFQLFHRLYLSLSEKTASNNLLLTNLTCNTNYLQKSQPNKLLKHTRNNSVFLEMTMIYSEISEN